MPKLYIMCGLAFSGKSTLARKIAEYTGSKIIAFDKLWIEKDRKKPISKNAKGWAYVRRIGQKEVLKYLNFGTSVVYDDNNPKRQHRDEFKNLAIKAGTDPIVIYLDTPLDIIRSREKANKISQDRHEVESQNFQKVLADMEVPTQEEGIVLVFTSETNLDEFLKILSLF